MLACGIFFLPLLCMTFDETKETKAWNKKKEIHPSPVHTLGMYINGALISIQLASLLSRAIALCCTVLRWITVKH